jgi:hypothetical protein
MIGRVGVAATHTSEAVRQGRAHRTRVHRLCRRQVMSVFTFPAVATLWKLHEMDLLGSERNQFANRIQHAGWAFCMLLVWAPIGSQYRSILSRTARTVWLAAVVTIAGNLGELFERTSLVAPLRSLSCWRSRLGTTVVAANTRWLVGWPEVSFTVWLCRSEQVQVGALVQVHDPRPPTCQPAQRGQHDGVCSPQ